MAIAPQIPPLFLLSLSFSILIVTHATRVPVHDQQLVRAQSALSQCLSDARSVSALVSSLAARGGMTAREAAAVRDCVETVATSVDELRRGVKEMEGGMGGTPGEVRDKVENVQTWVSAALTNEDTCVDGFSEKGMDGDVKRVIRSRIVDLARKTSGALAIINALG